MNLDLKRLAEQCLVLAGQVGVVLLDFQRGPAADLLVKKKSDHTPSTEADLAAHRILLAGLQKISPKFPVLSEEGEWPDFAERQQWTHYWLIDPLDGTRGFIAGLDEFSINIALIAENQPILGILYVPASQTAYYAWRGGGAFKKTADGIAHSIHVSPKPEKNVWRVLLGKYSRGKRLQQITGDQAALEFLPVNSAVKFGWMAEGRGDIYVRLSSISEWDTAAGQCILEEAGGAVVDLQGKPLRYNRQVSLLTTEFIALADLRCLEFWLNLLKNWEKMT